MNTFVQIQDYGNQYFLLVENEGQIPPSNILKRMQAKLRANIQGEFAAQLNESVSGGSDIEYAKILGNQMRARLEIIDANPINKFNYMDWVKKMVECINPEQKIIGYTVDESRWPVALEYMKELNVEIC